MKINTLTFKRLTCFIVFLMLFVFQGTSVKGQNTDNVVITGILVKKDGTIDTKKDIMLCPMTSEGGCSMVFSMGILKNPSVRPESNGSFKIVADRSFIGETQEFTLMYDFKFKLERNGILVVIKIDKKTKIVDLGEISIKQKP